MQKSEGNLETLQVAAECHSMNKNQSLIKIRPVVPEKNAKKWENFETLQLVAQCHSMNKNQSLIKIRPVVPEKNAKKWRKFGNIASGCRLAQHKQNWKTYQDHPVVPKNNAKKWEICETLQLAVECNSMNKNQCLMKTSSSSEKCKKVRKFWNFTIGCRVAQHKQKWKFDQDQISSFQEKCKNWEICETLQVAAECHSMNKNQSLMKTSSSSEKCKKWRKFWNFTIGCRVPQHKQKSKIYQDQTNSSWEICKKWRKFGNIASGCRLAQHKQNWKTYQDHPIVPKNNAKKWEICETLQLAVECNSMNKNQSLMKTSSSSEKCKKWENFESLQLAVECDSINKNQRFIKIKPVVLQKNAKIKKIWKLYNWL